MSQSKRHSVIEAMCNVGSGMLVGFTVSQLAHWGQGYIKTYIWSGFVWELSFSSNLAMTVVLTVLSLIRGYIWRRVFNRIQRRNK